MVADKLISNDISERVFLDNLSVIALKNGGIVVNWLDSYGFPKAQRFDNLTIAQGNAFSHPFYRCDEFIALADGSFMGIDRTHRGEISAHRYDNLGNYQDSSILLFNQSDYFLDFTALADGGYVVFYVEESYDPYISNIYGQRFNNSGSAQGDKFLVAPSNIYKASMGLVDGGFVFITHFQSTPDRYDLFAWHFDNLGVLQGDAVLLDSFPVGVLGQPQIAALADGGYVVVWTDAILDNLVLSARIFDSFGTAQGSKFLVSDDSQNEFTISTQMDLNSSHSVTTLADGGFVIVWSNSNYSDISGKRYDSLGIAQGNEFRINNNTVDSIQRKFPSVAALGDGGFVVVWEKTYNVGVSVADWRFEVNGKRFDASGNEVKWDYQGALADAIFKARGKIDGDEGITNLNGILEAGKIKVMADFAKAAYSIQSWEETLINDFKSYSDDAALGLVNAGTLSWNPIDLNPFFYSSTTQIDGIDISSKMREGFYVDGNAAAFVARSADAMVISFRGTNDNENYPKLLSPDQADWVNMTRHYGLMRPLVDALDNYIKVNGIQKVYVTGHSLGGAMAIKYMDDHVNGYLGANYESVVFAAASYDLIGSYDNRMTLIEIEGDIVADTGGNNGRNIHFVGNQTSGSSTAYHSMDYYRQMVDSIDNTAWDQMLRESGDQYVYIGGRILNADSFIVDGRRSGENSVFDEGNDALTDPLLSDYDIYYGGRGADVLVGGSDNELMLGGSGNDDLKGMGGFDRLFGGPGNDKLSGGSGADTLIGGLDDDSYIVDNINDAIAENLNEGVDKVSSNVTYKLSVNVEKLVLTGTSAINGAGNNLANVLIGNSAANKLSGGAGNDLLNGGAGIDTLTGGIDKDIFRFTTIGHIDTITDFSVIDDTIQLENLVFTTLAATGQLAADYFRIGTQALDANDFVIYNNMTGALFYDADGSMATAAAQIATMGVGLSLTNVNIVVI